MSTFKDKVNSINERIAKLKEEEKAIYQNEMKGLFKALFEDHPTLMTLVWDQYTPYFNDGDPCYFRRYSIFCEVDGIDSYDKNEFSSLEDAISECGYPDEVMLSTWSKNCPEDIKNAIKSLESTPDEMFELAFGDGVRVFATREGFEVEDRDHD